MKQNYEAKEFLEGVMAGSNRSGIDFLNESAYTHHRKTYSFTGLGYDNNFSSNIISAGILQNGVLEIGIDSSSAYAKSICGCLKDDVCRKLMLHGNYVRVIPKARYNAHLQLLPGDKVGHKNLAVNSSYGSLGFFLLPYNKNNNPHIVSNNHVLADSNNANIGDPVYALNGSGQRIGTLENYTKIYSPGQNRLDLAIAELNGFEAPIPKGSATYRTPVVGERVYKTGATTGKTQGYVRSLRYSSKINYGHSQALFLDQIQITTGIDNYRFSAGGDSGSIIRSNVDDAFVGLLFAGNNLWTLANHQTLVVKQLKDWGYPVK